MTLKYNDLIVESFDFLELKPRGNQIDIIDSVLVEFFDNNKRNVVLCAGTGVGKSIIGAVISDCVDRILEDEDGLPSIIMMQNNALAKQYTESFEHLGKYKYFQIKGASNYACNFMSAQTNNKFSNAEECARKKMHPDEVEKYCRGCEFHEAKSLVNTTKNLITNYAYFLTSSLVSNHLQPRKLHVFDEAHVFNDAYTSFSEITLSSELLNKYIKELNDTNDKCEKEAAALVLLKQRIENKDIGLGNYMACIEIVMGIYKSAAKKLDSLSNLLKGQDVIKSTLYERRSKKFASLADKISSFIVGKYDHVLEDSVPNTIAIKTIFVSDKIDSLLARKNLFMSATITDTMSEDIIGLNEKDTAFIMTPPVFPPENKPIFFVGNTALNYNSLKDPEVTRWLKNSVGKIVDFHKGQKGLIIAPSFFLGSSVVKGLNCKVFEHQQGKNLSELIKSFKEYSGSAILVSPSIFEGLDFKNDESRFQIILKSPFASLADKRIKYIADKYPTIYQEMTLLKILQGIGRSVRTPDDFAATYMLDSTSKKLYDSRLNLWKDHYVVKT